MTTFKNIIFGLILGALALCGVSVAQVISPIPVAPTVGTTDLIPLVVGGQPSAQTTFATAAQIAGVPGYTQVIGAITAFTYTAGNSTALLYLVPSGTLATGTLTMAANPSDGQVFTLMSSQTQTAITIQANTGQTLYVSNGVLATPTALVANTQYTWVYVKSQAAWFRVK